ncbi:polysaccharide biosynthesis C-terminal domain-containing protein [Caproiciproducens galactitolivorans]|uniref:Polysaccharide biosynthesis C-terminal domain-containing protein n=1 Tax=Caproiciproducens galactitolivorans TaxID=642589 RepID=A0ABT4BTA7_9FIRM|nr:polysaccharide biosynthesis C-terminal domain-containing protein [Caproiciproducens galactitolivorans]MCY1714129.1 polysaccharide biosynthesis C-terminal domain-containing protein [Caproiciproducens galactitolivorans]
MKDKKEPKIRSSIVRDALSTFGTTLFGAGMGFISALVITGVLDPASKGYITQLQYVGTLLVTFLSMSVSSAVIYYTSRYGLKNVKKALTTICIWIIVLIAVVGFASVFILRNSYFADTPFLYSVLAVVYGIFSFLSTVYTCILRGENKFSAYNIITLIQRILTTLFAFSVFFWKTPMVIILSSILIMVVMIFMCISVLRRSPEQEIAEEDDIVVSAGSIVKYSLKSHVSNILTYLNTYAANFIVKGYFKVAALGVYSFASTLMEQVWLLPNAVSMVIMSRIAGMKVQEDKVKLTLMSCKIVTYITFVCAFLLTWVAQVFVPIVFPKYVAAVPALRILIVGSIFITYAKVLANSIAAYGKPELNIISTAIGVVFNIILSFLLIPSMGIDGAALSTSISLTAQGITSIVIFCKFTKTAFYKLVIPSSEEIAIVKRVIKK